MMDLLSVWNSITIEQLFMTMLAIGIGSLYTALKVMQHQVRQLDKLVLLLCDRVARDAVKIHRSGDYEIVNPLNKEQR